MENGLRIWLDNAFAFLRVYALCLRVLLYALSWDLDGIISFEALLLRFQINAGFMFACFQVHK